MRKVLFSLAILAGSLSACNKELPSTGGDIRPIGGEPTDVQFRLSTVATKATTEPGSTNENKIKMVDAFVFNADGTLDGYANIPVADQTTMQVKVSATTGVGKHFVAVINAASTDEMGKVSKIADLAKVERAFLLDNNSREAFQMYGYTTQDLVAGTNTVTVKLNRAVSRVKVDKITRAFTVPSLAAQEMKITKLYVTNVVGSVANAAAYDQYFTTFKTKVGDVWFNKYNNDKSKGFVDFATEANVKSLTSIEIPVAQQTVADKASLTTADGYRLYVMPNDINPHAGKTTDEERLAAEQALQGLSVWAPCLTKLVIETQLAGKTYYYAIPLVKRTAYPQGEITSGISFNETFNFSEIKLTRPGSENPDVPTLVSDVNFTLDIQPWNVHVMETAPGAGFEI